MKFLRNIKRSIYDPGFYQEVSEKPFSSSFIYFLLFSLLVSILITPLFAFKFIPPALTFVSQINPTVLEFYPDELVITIADGEASTNVQEPYFWPIPDQVVQVLTVEGAEHVLVIDTTTPFSSKQFDSYRTIAWLTKEEIFVKSDERESLEVIPLRDIPNVTIDESFVSTQVSRFLAIFTPIARGFIFLSPLFILTGFFLYFVFRLVYLFFGAVVVWGIAKIKGINIGYQKSYQLGLHMMTPGLLFSAMSIVLGLDIGIPFLFTAVLGVTAWFNLKKEVADSEENLIWQ